MQPISRRSAIQLGALGSLSAAVGGGGLLWQRGHTFDTLVGDRLRQPSQLRSNNGRLVVDLVAGQGPVTIAGRPAHTLRYNGGLPGPTLRIRGGDSIAIRLVNRLETVTNLHVHGLHVSPEGNGDNVFLAVEPGESFSYQYLLPADHPPGVYWYHPHHHGVVADQVYGGLYGAILVEDPTSIPANRDRVLVISDLSLDASGLLRRPSAMQQMLGREGDLLLVNGQDRPVLNARAGERERWRIVNACSARYLQLRLGDQQMHVLGIDSGRYAIPQPVDDLLLAPGNRADLLVTASAGHHTLQALPYDRGGMGMMGGGLSSGSRTVATLEVGEPSISTVPAVPQQPEPRDLRQAPVSRRRRIVFSAGMGAGMGMGGSGMDFTVDGRSFDAGRLDQAVRLGAVEEWLLVQRQPDGPPHPPARLADASH